MPIRFNQLGLFLVQRIETGKKVQRKGLSGSMRVMLSERVRMDNHYPAYHMDVGKYDDTRIIRHEQGKQA